MQTFKVGKSAIESPSLPGKIMTAKAFEKWIRQAEMGPSVSFLEAKSNWIKKRKLLRCIVDRLAKLNLII